MSGDVTINFISLGLLGALLLRWVVRMEGFHWARVVILTALLWLPVAYLILAAFLTPGDYYRCMPDVDADVYTCTEL